MRFEYRGGNQGTENPGVDVVGRRGDPGFGERCEWNLADEEKKPGIRGSIAQRQNRTWNFMLGRSDSGLRLETRSIFPRAKPGMYCEERSAAFSGGWRAFRTAGMQRHARLPLDAPMP